MLGRPITHKTKHIILIVTGIVYSSRKYTPINFMRQWVFIQHLRLVIHVLGSI